MYAIDVFEIQSEKNKFETLKLNFFRTYGRREKEIRSTTLQFLFEKEE